MPYIYAIIATFTIAVAGIFGILSILPPYDVAPAKVLTVHDRAAWGIGEDGTRIAPQPETIRINLR